MFHQWVGRAAAKINDAVRACFTAGLATARGGGSAAQRRRL